MNSKSLLSSSGVPTADAVMCSRRLRCKLFCGRPHPINNTDSKGYSATVDSVLVLNRTLNWKSAVFIGNTGIGSSIWVVFWFSLGVGQSLLGRGIPFLRPTGNAFSSLAYPKVHVHYVKNIAWDLWPGGILLSMIDVRG